MKYTKKAKSYAKQLLIPEDIWKNGHVNEYSNISDIVYFAENLQISPAIPAGRIRYETKNYKMFTGLIGNRTVKKMFKE